MTQPRNDGERRYFTGWNAASYTQCSRRQSVITLTGVAANLSTHRGRRAANNQKTRGRRAANKQERLTRH